MAAGWSLARGGWDVTMVDANPSKLDAGARDGISVNGVGERNVRFSSFANWTPPRDALVLLCTKTYDNAAVLARLPERCLLMPVQNGFEALLEQSSHPFEAIASFVSQCEPDRPATRITRRGELYLGGRRALAPGERGMLENVAAAFRRGGLKQVKVVDAIGPYKSAKLMYNAAISPLAAAAGLDNAELLRDPLAQRIFFALLLENYAILERNGVRLARIGPFHPRVVAHILRLPGLARMLAHFFRPGLRGTYCSMARDIGTEQTEIAAYNGYLLRLARGVCCPINSAVVEMITAMHVQRRPPGREMLAGLDNAIRRGVVH